jgi:hypothetical protein
MINRDTLLFDKMHSIERIFATRKKSRSLHERNILHKLFQSTLKSYLRIGVNHFSSTSNASTSLGPSREIESLGT